MNKLQPSDILTNSGAFKEVDSMKILIAVDGTEASTAAADVARSLFPDAEFILLSVAMVTQMVGSDPIGGGSFALAPTEDMMEAIEASADDAVADAAQKIAAGHATTTVEIGDPARVICDEVDRIHADLVVVGRGSKGWLSRLFDPSVADYVVKHANCPVLVVKEHDHVEQQLSSR